MRFLVDECLHMSLVDVATTRGHEAHHVNWVGLGGEDEFDADDEPVNEAVEVHIEGGQTVIERYALPDTDEP